MPTTILAIYGDKALLFDENFSNVGKVFIKVTKSRKSFHQRKFLSTISFHFTMFIFENISAKIIFRCLGLNFRNYLLINYSSFWYKKISSSKKRPKKVKKKGCMARPGFEPLNLAKFWFWETGALAHYTTESSRYLESTLEL